MRTIFKYPFEIKDEIQISMPEGAEILAIQIQRGVPCMWALVVPGEQEEARRFMIYGTGHEIYKSGKYIATFQTGSLVWHVFERLD